jgi:hypothetical protein
MQDYPAAVDVFERLLEFQPNDLGHYTNLGRCRKCALYFTSFEPILLQFSRDGGRLRRGRARVHARGAEQAVRPFVLPQSRALQVKQPGAFIF